MQRANLKAEADKLDEQEALKNWKQRTGSLNASNGAPSFHQQDVSPAAVHTSEPFPNANTAKAKPRVQPDAGHIFRKNSRLQRPNPRALGGFDQRSQQLGPYSLASGALGDVYTYFGDARVHASVRNRTQRRPAENVTLRTCHEPTGSKMARVPLRPVGRGGFEGGIARGDSFQIDGTNRAPILFRHRLNRNGPLARHRHVDTYIVQRCQIQIALRPFLRSGG